MQHIDNLHNNIIYINLDDDFYKEYVQILNDHTLKDICEAGICELMSKKDTKK